MPTMTTMTTYMIHHLYAETDLYCVCGALLRDAANDSWFEHHCDAPRVLPIFTGTQPPPSTMDTEATTKDHTMRRIERAIRLTIIAAVLTTAVATAGAQELIDEPFFGPPTVEQGECGTKVTEFNGAFHWTTFDADNNVISYGQATDQVTGENRGEKAAKRNERCTDWRAP